MDIDSKNNMMIDQEGKIGKDADKFDVDLIKNSLNLLYLNHFDGLIKRKKS